jgi:GxxExxY protein
MYVDEDEEPDPRLNELTNAIIGAAIAVHSALGPPYAESIYEEALAVEFDARGIPYVRQHVFDVIYRDRVVGTGRIDFIVADEVVLEVKTVESISSVHVAQVIAYLRAKNKRLGLILNFKVKRLTDGIRRVAN